MYLCLMCKMSLYETRKQTIFSNYLWLFHVWYFFHIYVRSISLFTTFFQYYLLLHYICCKLNLLLLLFSVINIFFLINVRDVIWIGPRQKTDWSMCVKISRQENETEDNDCLGCPPTHYWNAKTIIHIPTLYKLCVKLELYLDFF